MRQIRDVLLCSRYDRLKYSLHRNRENEQQLRQLEIKLRGFWACSRELSLLCAKNWHIAISTDLHCFTFFVSPFFLSLFLFLSIPSPDEFYLFLFISTLQYRIFIAVNHYRELLRWNLYTPIESYKQFDFYSSHLFSGIVQIRGR